MITAIKISLLWIPISILFFIIRYGGDSSLQAWQAMVSGTPVLLVTIVELVKSHQKAH